MAGSGRARANVEIKARCADPGAARAAALRLAPERLGTDAQVDTYFRTRTGRLKLRESRLAGAQLILYRRDDVAGPRRSDYRVYPVDDAADVREALGRLLGVHRVVRKEREILRVDNVRVHLDRVDGLGTFLELEAVFDPAAASGAEEHRKVHGLLRALGIRDADLVPQSYEGLMAGT